MIANILMMSCTVTTLIAYVPQIARILIRKESDDISVSSWALWLFEGVCYVIYAIIQKDPVFILAEVTGLFCVLAVLALTLKYRKEL